MSAAEKMQERPRPWRQGTPILTAQLEAGAVWRGLRDASRNDSNVYHQNRQTKCRAWFHAGLVYFEHEEYGTAVISMDKMRFVELDLA